MKALTCCTVVLVGWLVRAAGSVTQASEQHKPRQGRTAFLETYRFGTLKRVTAVIGVMTTFDEFPPKEYSYALRRQYLRETWFPASEAELLRYEKDHQIILRFVVGRSANKDEEAAVRKEEAQRGKFIWLPLKESYLRLHLKVQAFWKYVSSYWLADYVLKIDDDKYVRLDRVPYALKQWKQQGAGYVGCFQMAKLIRNQTGPDARWYNPSHALVYLGMDSDGSYYAEGTFYAIAGYIVQALANMPLPMRNFGAEDMAVGYVLRAFEVKFLDDPRLCELSCGPSLIAINIAANHYHSEVCTPMEEWNLTCFEKIHNNASCRLPTLDASGTLPPSSGRALVPLDTDVEYVQRVNDDELREFAANLPDGPRGQGRRRKGKVARASVGASAGCLKGQPACDKRDGSNRR